MKNIFFANRWLVRGLFTWLALTLNGGAAWALDGTWTGAKDSVFSDADNWEDGEPPYLGNAVFIGDSAVNNPVIDLSNDLNGLVFRSAGWRLGGNGTLILGSNGIDAKALTAGTLTLSVADLIINNTQAWVTGTNNTSGLGATLNVSSNLSGTAGLNIGQTGYNTYVNLLGDNRAYNGNITMHTWGQLGLGSATALGSGTLFTYATTTLENVADSALTITNNWAISGAVTVLAAKGLTFSGSVLANGGNLTVSSGAVTLSGNVAGSSLIKTGTGALTLTGSNNLTSEFRLSAGVANLNHAYAAAGNGTLVFWGGTFNNTSGAAITLLGVGAVELNGNLNFVGDNDLDLTNSALTSRGNADRTANIEKGTLTVSGVNFGLSKSGSGTLLVTGDYTKTTATNLDINGGVLAIGGNYSNAGTLRLNGGILAAHGTVGAMSFVSPGGSGLRTGFNAYGGDLTVSRNASAVSWIRLAGYNNILVLSGSLSTGIVDFQSNLDLDGNGNHAVLEVVKVSGAAKIDARISGTLTSGAGPIFDKTGDGTLELSGGNTGWFHTNVLAGTVLITGSTAQRGTITVSAGATLGGSGFIGNPRIGDYSVGIVITSGGRLDPSGRGALAGFNTLTLDLNAPASTYSPGVLNLNAGAILGFTLGADGDNDRVHFENYKANQLLGADLLTFSSFDFTTTADFDQYLSVNDTAVYELITGLTLPLAFSDLTGSVNGHDAAIQFTNNALVLTVTAVPEPSALALLLTGAALLALTFTAEARRARRFFK